MPFSTLKPLMVKAEALLGELQLRRLDETLDLCAAGLGHLGRETASYQGMVPFCAAILPHFEDELTQLVALLEACRASRGTEVVRARFGEIQERAFCLVEDMALFAREKKLRSGCAEQAEAEERLTVYFETSGHWAPEQGILVTDMYYTQIPAAILTASGISDSENTNFPPHPAL